MAVNRAQIEIAARDATGAAFAQVGARFRGLQGDIDGLAGRFAGLQATLAAGLGGFGIANFVTNVAEGIDAIGDLSDATGASVENVSRLETSIRRAGGSFEDASSLLIKFNQALANATPGSEIEGVFKRLGLSVAELRKQDPVNALLATAQAFRTFESDGELARAQTEILGKSIGKLSPVLKDLADQGANFGTVTAQQAEAADAFVKALGRVRAQVEDVARGTVSDLLPAITEVLNAFASADDKAQGLVETGGILRTVFEALSILGLNVAFTFKGVGREIGAIGAQLVALATLDLDGFNAISQAVKEDGERARAELDALERRILQAGKSQGASYSNEGRNAGSALKAFAPAGSKDVAKQVSEFEKYIDRLGQAQIATLDLSAEEQARIDIVTGRLGKLTAAQEDQVMSLARGLDLLKKSGEFNGPIIPADVLAERQAQIKAIDQLIASSTGARFEALTRTQQALAEEFRNGTRTALEYERATESLGKAFEDLEPKIKAVEETASAFAEQAASNIQDALASSLISSFEGNSRQIEDIWKDLIKRLVAQAAAAKLAETLFGANYGKGGQIGGWIGMLLSSFGGGGGLNYSGQFDGFRANGGPVTAGRAYVVGERGPEIMVPQQSGTVLPNGTGMGGATFNVIVQGDASANTIRLIQQAQANFEARMRGGR